MMEADVSSKRS